MSWYVTNARDATWYHTPGRSAICDLEGDTEFPQYGVNLSVLQPGESMGLYHAETDQEDFLMLSGEALLIVEGEERPLVKWDFFHCPAGTRHMIVGAGSGPALVLAIGAREHVGEPDNLFYPVDETARRHGVSAAADTYSPDEAYADTPHRQPSPFQNGWLPE
jgi:uncharacterized cupin superfamily protein